MGDEDYFDSIFATLDTDGSGLVETAAKGSLDSIFGAVLEKGSFGVSVFVNAEAKSKNGSSTFAPKTTKTILLNNFTFIY